MEIPSHQNQKEKDLLNHKRKKTDSKSKSTKKKHEKRQNFTKSNQRPNRKKLLKNKLEFFFSDINLYHDNYLKKIYFSNNRSIPPEIFLSFNSIKTLLCDIKDNENKKDVIIKAVEISNKLKYDKSSNQIKRNVEYIEKNVDIDFYDKCTIFIENLPKVINHQIIYDTFQNYKILYISLIKDKKNKKFSGNAFITFKNFEDIDDIVKKYDNFIPSTTLSLNVKELKPLHVITKKEWEANNKNKNINLKNEQKEENKDLNLNLNFDKENKNNDKNDDINMAEIKENNGNKDEIKKDSNNNNEIIEEKNKINIDENYCVKISNLKENVSLNDFKKIISNIIEPLFIDINRKENNAILRFSNKNNSDIFTHSCEENNNSLLKDFVIEGQNNVIIEELNKEENEKYIQFVKKEIENFKEKKMNTKLNKSNNKNKKIINIENIDERNKKNNLDKIFEENMMD